MVRLMLVLAPVMCILSAIGISSVLFTFMKNVDGDSTKSEKKLKKFDDNYPKKSEIATLVVFFVSFFLVTYVFHCTWVTSEAYSSPSIVLSANSQSGKVIFDDFRESYYWLRHNTPEVIIKTLSNFNTVVELKRFILFYVNLSNFLLSLTTLIKTKIHSQFGSRMQKLCHGGIMAIK